MTRLAKRMMVVGLVVTFCAVAQGQTQMSLEDALKQLPTYNYGQSRVALTGIEAAVRGFAGDEAKRADLAEKLTVLLSTKGTTTDAKRYICRQLSVIGGAKSVPALARLLADKELSHMGRYALQRIPGAEADAALRTAMGDLQGKLRIGMINSIGERRDAKAADALTEVLGGSDTDAAIAAASALGKIGGDTAAKALAHAKDNKKLAGAAVDAYLVCADAYVAAGETAKAEKIYREMYAVSQPRRVRIAALEGLASGLGAKAVGEVLAVFAGDDTALAALATTYVRRSLPGTAATQAIAAKLPSLPADRQALLLAALADRGDRAARPAVATAAGSNDQSVRLAAIAALGSLGAETDAAMLLAAMGQGGEIGAAAKASLSRMGGDGVDAAVVQAMNGATGPAKTGLIDVLVNRRAVDAVGALLAVAGGGDKAISAAALEAVAKLAGPKDLSALVAMLLKADTSAGSAIRKALVTACRGIADESVRLAPITKAMVGAGVPVRCTLLAVLGQVGGTESLKLVSASLDGSNAEITDAAVRALTTWPATVPAEELLAVTSELLNVAKESSSPVHPVLALRAYHRLAVIRGAADRNGGVKLLVAGVAAAKRIDEKKLMVSGLAKLPSLAAAKAAHGLLSEADLNTDAGRALVAIAGGFRRSRNRGEKAKVKEILVEAAKVIADRQVLAQAKAAAKRL